MGIFDIFRKKRKQNPFEELLNDPVIKSQREMFELLSAENALEGCSTDEIPSGIGEFGYDATNPIPTNTPIGSNLYLGGLRTPDGQRINYRRIGPVVVDNIKKPVDAYQLSDQSDKDLCIIYISPYQARNSRKAPDGFSQVSPLL